MSINKAKELCQDRSKVELRGICLPSREIVVSLCMYIVKDQLVLNLDLEYKIKIIYKIKITCNTSFTQY